MIGASTFGTICEKIMRALLHPMERAASMYSLSFTVKTCARMMRANSGDCVTISAIIILRMLLPSAATMLTQSIMVGMPIKISMMRMMILSTLG